MFDVYTNSNDISFTETRNVSPISFMVKKLQTNIKMTRQAGVFWTYTLQTLTNVTFVFWNIHFEYNIFNENMLHIGPLSNSL